MESYPSTLHHKAAAEGFPHVKGKYPSEVDTREVSEFPEEPCDTPSNMLGCEEEAIGDIVENPAFLEWKRGERTLPLPCDGCHGPGVTPHNCDRIHVRGKRPPFVSLYVQRPRIADAEDKVKKWEEDQRVNQTMPMVCDNFFAWHDRQSCPKVHLLAEPTGHTIATQPSLRTLKVVAPQVLCAHSQGSVALHQWENEFLGNLCNADPCNKPLNQCTYIHLDLPAAVPSGPDVIWNSIADTVETVLRAAAEQLPPTITDDNLREDASLVRPLALKLDASSQSKNPSWAAVEGARLRSKSRRELAEVSIIASFISDECFLDIREWIQRPLCLPNNPPLAEERVTSAALSALGPVASCLSPTLAVHGFETCRITKPDHDHPEAWVALILNVLPHGSHNRCTIVLHLYPEQRGWATDTTNFTEEDCMRVWTGATG